MFAICFTRIQGVNINIGILHLLEKRKIRHLFFKMHYISKLEYPSIFNTRGQCVLAFIIKIDPQHFLSVDS